MLFETLAGFHSASLQRKAEEKRDEAVEKTEKESAGGKSRKRQSRKMIEDLPVLETEVIKPDGVDLSLYCRIGEDGRTWADPDTAGL
jgi:transposase